jgi:hypothetical protein
MEHSSIKYSAISPKYTHYSPDGAGRDAYISANNGGLLQTDTHQIPHIGYVRNKNQT